MTAPLLQANPDDLVKLSLQINTDHLFSVLQSLMDTVGKQQSAIERLERNTTALFQKMELNEGSVEKKFQTLQSVSSMATSLVDIDRKFDSLEHEMDSMKKRSEESTQELVQMSNNLQKQSQEREAQNEAFQKERQELEEKIQVVKHSAQSTMETTKETTVKQMETMLEKAYLADAFIRSQIDNCMDELREGTRKQMHAVFDRIEDQSNAIAESGVAVKKLSEGIAYAKDLVQQSTEEMNNNNVKRFMSIEDHIAQEKTRLNILYHVLRLDESAMQKFHHESNVKRSKFMESIRGNKTAYNNAVQSSVMRPQTLQTIDAVSQLLGKKPNEKKPAGWIDPELDDLYTSILLETPPFQMLRAALLEDMNAVGRQKSREIQSVKSEHGQRFEEVEYELKTKINKDSLETMLNEHKQIADLKETTDKNKKDIEFVTVYYLSREQAYKALTTKADNSRVEQKADRKFVSSVFDYVNQKLNTLLGEASSDDLIREIKKLEEQIEHQNELIKLERRRSNSKNDAKEDHVSPIGFSNGRCLSCNRPAPVETSSGAKPGIHPSKSQDIVTIPALVTNKPSLRELNPQKRLESYYQWLQNNAKQKEEEMEDENDHKYPNPQAPAHVPPLTMLAPRLRSRSVTARTRPTSAIERRRTRPHSAREQLMEPTADIVSRLESEQGIRPPSSPRNLTISNRIDTITLEMESLPGESQS